MSGEKERIPDSLLSYIVGGQLQPGWQNELNVYIQEYKSKGFSCGNFMEIIKGTPEIFGAASDKERQTVLDYIDNNWDSM